MYISQKPLLKSSTRSDRWLSKVDLKKEKSKLSGHVKDQGLCSKIVTNDFDHLPHKQLQFLCLKTLVLNKVSMKSARNGYKLYNWQLMKLVFLEQSHSPPFHKISVRGQTFISTFWIVLQKETGLLCSEYGLEGLFDKTGHGWSRGEQFLSKHEMERLLGYDRP